MTRTIALVLFAALAPASAFAQTQHSTPPAQPQRVQHIDIDEDDVIEGGLSGPDGTTIRGDNRPSFSGLIQVRERFREKVLASADEL